MMHGLVCFHHIMRVRTRGATRAFPEKYPPPMIPYDPLPTLLSICTLAIMNHQRPGFRTRPCSGSAAFLAGDSLHHPHHLQDGPCQYRVIKTKLNHPRAIVFPILSSPLLLPSALQSVVLSYFPMVPQTSRYYGGPEVDCDVRIHPRRPFHHYVRR